MAKIYTKLEKLLPYSVNEASQFVCEWKQELKITFTCSCMEKSRIAQQMDNKQMFMVGAEKNNTTLVTTFYF